MDSQEFIERSIILLLAQDKKEFTLTRLQKEMFLFSEIKKELKEDLNFEKHYLGPYSRVLDETIVAPTYFSKVFKFNNTKVYLSDEGMKEYKKMLEENNSKNQFNLLISSLKVLRTIYDQLTERELLFLIYVTYPEYKKNSSVSNFLLSEPNRSKILNSLKNKGIITSERYKELKNG